MVGLNASKIIGLLEMQEELTRPVDIVMMPLMSPTFQTRTATMRRTGCPRIQTIWVMEV